MQSFADVVKVKHPEIVKHIIFVLGASVFIFVVAAHKTNIETKFWTSYLASEGWGMETNDMQFAQFKILFEKFQTQLMELKVLLNFAPAVGKSVILRPYKRLTEMYLDASEGQRAGYGIAAVNVGIWVAWQIPVLQPFMMTHFMHDPLSGKTYTLLTCVFSHASLMHLMLNCSSLPSFASATSIWMTREQTYASSHLRESTATYHFLALYLSSGLFSSLASHLVQTRIIYPRSRLPSKLVGPEKTGFRGIDNGISSAVESNARPATADAATEDTATEDPATEDAATADVAIEDAATEDAAAATPTILPSLGASGAIYSTTVITMLAFPDTGISFAFSFTPYFPIQYGVGGMVLLDCIGVLRGWRFFDHHMHLGGAVFGALYYTYGMRMWDAMRVQVHTLE